MQQDLSDFTTFCSCKGFRVLLKTMVLNQLVNFVSIPNKAMCPLGRDSHRITLSDCLLFKSKQRWSSSFFVGWPRVGYGSGLDCLVPLGMKN